MHRHPISRQSESNVHFPHIQTELTHQEVHNLIHRHAISDRYILKEKEESKKGNDYLILSCISSCKFYIKLQVINEDQLIVKKTKLEHNHTPLNNIQLKINMALNQLETKEILNQLITYLSDPAFKEMKPKPLWNRFCSAGIINRQLQQLNRKINKTANYHKPIQKKFANLIKKARSQLKIRLRSEQSTATSEQLPDGNSPSSHYSQNQYQELIQFYKQKDEHLSDYTWLHKWIDL